MTSLINRDRQAQVVLSDNAEAYLLANQMWSSLVPPGERVIVLRFRYPYLGIVLHLHVSSIGCMTDGVPGDADDTSGMKNSCGKCGESGVYTDGRYGEIEIEET